MANSKLSDLNLATGLSDDDLFYLVDVSEPIEANQSKKLKYSTLLAYVLNNLPRGSASFNGSAGVTVAIGVEMPDTGYYVLITPTGDPLDVGPYWVDSKGLSSFVVKNWGSGTPTFDWLVIGG